MNEMRFHCKPFAIDEVLTRMMEVELFQRVHSPAHLERVAFRKQGNESRLTTHRAEDFEQVLRII